MIMKKNLFLAAVALVALASCTSDEFVGDNSSPNTGANGEKAISFGSSAAKVTRATSNTGSVSVMLDGQFKVYGTKNVDNVYSIVFPNYVAWNNNSLTATTSNPDASDPSNGWEYVGPSTTTYGSGSTLPTIGKEQTIKYWDYSAANYHFVAGSPVANFTYTITNNDIVSAAVKGLAGHINANPTSGSGTAITTDPVYIAKPVTVLPDDYNKPVKFEFVRQQSRVRVGIFETIPGYKITEIKFYPYGDSGWGSSSSDNIILASTTANYFQGGTNDVVEGTITYNWTTTPASYSFTYAAASGKSLVQKKNWYGGEYNYAASGSDAAWGQMAITSTESNIKKLYGKDADMDAITGYFTVLPTAATTASPLLIKCDYTLTSEVDNSGETIKVYGATAAIPAAFCKWAPNTSYTYLFKISDNTNGKTNPNKPAVGLFPITFDAVAIAEDNAEMGYITTVSTPSITTYQEGSVIASGIEYVINKAITVTVTNDATGAVLSINGDTAGEGYIQVYSLGTTAMTEADLQLNPPTTGALGISITDDVLSFTPTSAGYYAVRYQTSTSPVAYAYKVIEVVAAHANSNNGGGN